MARVGIVTDTIASLPPEVIRQYDIRIVPLALNINGKGYRDQMDITSDQFWAMFKEVKQFTTAAPALGDFSAVFKELGKSTREIACTFVSKALSGTHEAALQAREVMKQEDPSLNIEIFDSRTAAGAQGFIVLEMARAAQAGKGLAEVVRAGQDMIHRVKFLVGMETLKYLIKSGRAPKTAYAGELFQVKPIIGMVQNTGAVENIGRVRGKDACMAKLIDLISSYIDVNKPLHVNAHYTDNMDDGRKLLDAMTSRFKCTEAYVSRYSPVMSGHTGPVFAVSFYS